MLGQYHGAVRSRATGGAVAASSRTKGRSLPGARSKARSLRLESAGDRAIEILDRRDPGDGVEYGPGTALTLELLAPGRKRRGANRALDDLSAWAAWRIPAASSRAAASRSPARNRGLQN